VLNLPFEKTLLPAVSSSPDQKEVGKVLRPDHTFGDRPGGVAGNGIKRGEHDGPMFGLRDDRVKCVIERIAE
jgi:hypothetical protein